LITVQIKLSFDNHDLTVLLMWQWKNLYYRSLFQMIFEEKNE